MKSAGGSSTPKLRCSHLLHRRTNLQSTKGASRQRKSPRPPYNHRLPTHPSRCARSGGFNFFSSFFFGPPIFDGADPSSSSARPAPPGGGLLVAARRAVALGRFGWGRFNEGFAGASKAGIMPTKEGAPLAALFLASFASSRAAARCAAEMAVPAARRALAFLLSFLGLTSFFVLGFLVFSFRTRGTTSLTSPGSSPSTEKAPEFSATSIP
mmetsp:Transcript_27804/g.69883  ORF Transcript_27804/g.69883 Transcript_27804/m.69883 type:complete len:211 (+) Transcript_27804:341-973(+)